MKKKLVPLLMTAAMLLSSCGTGNGDSTATNGAGTSDPATSQTGSESTGTKEISVMLWYRDIDEADFTNLQFHKDISEQTGINATITAVAGNDWPTKLNLMFASGDYPDIIMRGNNTDPDIEKYGVDQGILLPLDDYIDQYMPNYKALLEYDSSAGYEDMLRASNGQTYQLGWIVPQNISVNGHLFVNQTWLDNLGLSVPTTVDQFEEMLIAFRDDDPNRNGENDEIPYSGTLASSVDSTFYLLSFWGIPYSNNTWAQIDNDGQVTSTLLNENLRAAMETLNSWYSAGLMDVESVAQDTTSFESKVNTGTVGSFFRWRMLAMGTEDEVVEQYEAIVPVTAIEGVTPQLTRYLEIPGFGAALTVNCTDVEAAYTWLDAQFEFENICNAYYGEYQEIDGTQYGWRYNDEGKVEFFTTITDSVPGQSAMHFFSGTEYFEKFELPVQRIEKIEYCEMYEDAGVVEASSAQILTDLTSLTIDEIEQIDLLKAELDKYAQEAFVSFITKGVTDDGWNTYLSTLDNLKIDRYMQIYQDAYDRYLETVN